MDINLQTFSEDVKEELSKALKSEEFISELKKIEKAEDSGTFSVTASTEDVDRAGEVVQAEGWDFENFKKNPVILFGHNHDRLPIGKATNVEVKENKLVLEGKFATHDFAQKVRKLHEEDVMNAVSVGFIAKEREGNVITKAELLEVSFVPVPANPNALANAFDVKELILDEKDEEDTPSPSDEEGGNAEEEGGEESGEEGGEEEEKTEKEPEDKGENAGEEVKEGRVLSKTNRKKVIAARDALEEVLKASRVEEAVEASPSENDTDGGDTKSQAQFLREVMQGVVHKMDTSLKEYRDMERENYQSN